MNIRFLRSNWAQVLVQSLNQARAGEEACSFDRLNESWALRAGSDPSRRVGWGDIEFVVKIGPNIIGKL